MEREGAIALPPAPLSETPRSEGPKKYIRNVEAVGSNPITSTRLSLLQRSRCSGPTSGVRLQEKCQGRTTPRHFPSTAVGWSRWDSQWARGWLPRFSMRFRTRQRC
jgi:hypothetical protein